jgi:hypothetical protein
MKLIVAGALALLVSCSPASLDCVRLQVRSDKLASSTGPPPYYGTTLCGSVSLKQVPEGIVIGPDSLPKKLVGAEGSAEFIPQFSRVRMVDGVLTFKGTIGQEFLFNVTGMAPHREAVRIDFEDSKGRSWSAKGTLETVEAQKDFHPDLERGLKP